MTNHKQKPELDEQTLQKLLEAAFVLQEDRGAIQASEVEPSQSSAVKAQKPPNRRASDTAPPRRNKSEPADGVPSKDEYTLTLAQIVETQRQIQTRHLEFEKAMAVIAESVAKITNAGGAAIAILEEKKVRYRAVCGPQALPLDSELPVDNAICAACLRTGQAIRCNDVNLEFLIDPEACRARGIQALIAVPVFHDGSVAGALEVYFSTPGAFTEQDVHTSQLMAGLVTEAFARNSESAWKKSLASERAAMLEALEKLKPNLGALTTNAAAPQTESIAGALEEQPIPSATFPCYKCGHLLVIGEQFCGKCGAARSTAPEPATLQSKVASLWHMQEDKVGSSNGDLSAAGDREPSAELQEDPGGWQSVPAENHFALAEHGVAESEFKEESASIALSETESRPEAHFIEPVWADLPEKTLPSSKDAILNSTDEITWGSASTTRDALEAIAALRAQNPFRRFFNAHRGELYLAVAIILIGAVIRWGIWSENSVSATGAPDTAATARRRKPAPDADLSMLDKLMIGVGLADPPEQPEYKGNPETQVWVDLHTALYYCPGSDLYGNTPKGKFTSQRDAQLDQFEPASRKACN